MRTTARDTSGAVDGAPPARSSGTSTSTVPATCTSGVRVVLLQTRKSKTRRCCRTRRAASRRGQGRRRAAQQHGAGRQTDTDWCPITCCGLDVRVRCEGFYFWVTQEIGVRYPILGYLEFRVKRQGEDDGRKRGRMHAPWPTAMRGRGSRGQPMREKKSEQSHSEVTAVTLPLIANSMMYMCMRASPVAAHTEPG